MLRLMPEQYYSLTIREYALMCKGYVDVSNRKMETYAWICCNLMNIHLEKRNRVKLDDLLPNNDSKEGKMKQELRKNASNPMNREAAVNKLLEANLGKFNS